jgi:hypothetical protein
MVKSIHFTDSTSILCKFSLRLQNGEEERVTNKRCEYQRLASYAGYIQ